MDMQMPAGFEQRFGFAKREIGRRRHMPIVAMSAHALRAIRNSASRPGWTAAQFARAQARVAY